MGSRIEQIIALVALALLVLGVFFVLRPFLSAILWAIILCFSTWPLYTWVLPRWP
jgi:predicted PurR-regulated permease PerM